MKDRREDNRGEERNGENDKNTKQGKHTKGTRAARSRGATEWRTSERKDSDAFLNPS